MPQYRSLFLYSDDSLGSLSFSILNSHILLVCVLNVDNNFQNLKNHNAYFSVSVSVCVYRLIAVRAIG